MIWLVDFNFENSYRLDLSWIPTSFIYHFYCHLIIYFEHIPNLNPSMTPTLIWFENCYSMVSYFHRTVFCFFIPIYCSLLSLSFLLYLKQLLPSFSKKIITNFYYLIWNVILNLICSVGFVGLPSELQFLYYQDCVQMKNLME